MFQEKIESVYCLEKQWAEQKTNTDLVYRLNHGDVGQYLGKTNIPSARGTSLITRAAYVADRGY